MKHPEIQDFFPPDTGLETIMKVWKENPELYRFIQALNEYIDWLESDLEEDGQICRGCGKRFNNPKSVKVDFCKECLIEVQTSHGPLTFKKVNYLEPDKFVIIDKTKNPDHY